MSAGAAGARRRKLVSEEPPRETRAGRSPMAQLLHALNQPLTGLQCSLEVTLASPRTNEQYVKSMRDALALTERMRMLVEAVREVVEIGETDCAERVSGAGGWRGIVREAAGELKLVAEAKRVKIALDVAGNVALNVADASPISAPLAETRRSLLAQGIFRLLESALALAARGTVLRIDDPAAAGDGKFCVRWDAPVDENRSALSRAEIGLLIAQAQLERSGACWERQTTERGERLTVQMAGCRDGASKNA